MTKNLHKLSGVFTPVVTPFKTDTVSEDSLRFNLRKLNQSGLTGYLALGSNAEFRSLSDNEQLRILEIFAEEKGDKVVMAGVGCESSHQTIEKAKAAAGLGLDYVSVLTPGYFKKQINGTLLRAFYERVADESPLPVLLYNAPGFTGIQIPLATIRELAGHPNIVGIKDSSSVGPGRLLLHCAEFDDFHVLAGTANFFYPMLHLGASGGIISLSNVLPDLCCELYRLFTDRKYDEALALHRRLALLNNAVSGSYGVPAVKAVMNLLGWRGDEPRHPLVALEGETLLRIRETLRTDGLLH